MQTGGTQLHELVSKKRLNKGSHRACHQFSMRPSTFPLLLCSSLSLRRWTCIHYIQLSWVIWILFGFWRGEPGQETRGESEVRVFNLLSPSLCGRSLAWRSLLLRQWEILFPGPGTSPSLLPWGPDPGSYTIPWSSPSGTSCLVMYPFVDWSSQRILSGMCHPLAAVGPCLREGHGGGEEAKWPWGICGRPKDGLRERMEMQCCPWRQGQARDSVNVGWCLPTMKRTKVRRGLLVEELLSKLRGFMLFTMNGVVPEGFWSGRLNNWSLHFDREDSKQTKPFKCAFSMRIPLK